MRQIPQELNTFTGQSLEIEPHTVSIRGRAVKRAGFRGVCVGFRDGGRRGVLVLLAGKGSNGLRIAPARAIARIRRYLEKAK